MNKKILGIDLGTTYSCVAYMNENGQAESIRNIDNMTTTPSVVWFEDGENQVVGEEAKNYAVTDPNNAVAFIKRDMGTDDAREIHGKQYKPEVISAIILKHLVDNANATLREQGILGETEYINQCVITCPAYFGLKEKNATKQAGIIAGLDVLDIINEPTAAAIHYGIIKGDENLHTRMLVYDLGGGTFDVTVIDINGHNIDVVCTGGDPHLGGKDWDEATLRFLQERWNEEKGTEEDILDDAETRGALLQAAEKAKKSLTSRDKTMVNVIHQGETLRVELTRDQFDEYTNTLLSKTVELTNLCLEDMKAKDSRPVDGILLVGGSSYMPQVKKRLEDTYHLPVSIFDPNEAVAKGAAIYAQNIAAYNLAIDTIAQRTGKSAEEVHSAVASGESLSDIAKQANVELAHDIGKLNISNVSSRTYGIKYLDRQTYKISNFIFQNDKLPASNKQTFATLTDNQTGVQIELYEMFGMDKVIEDGETVKAMEPAAIFQMELKKPVPANTPIEMTMTLNNSGLITLYAVEKSTGSELNASYQVKDGLSQEEMQSAITMVRNNNIQ